jgi:hypothetical protein
MNRYAAFATVVFFSVSLLLFPRFSFSDDRVSLDVQVVHASSGKTFVDPTLVSLKEKLVKLFNYSSFEIISKARKEARKGEVVQFSIPGGRNMAIVPVEATGDVVKLDVKIGGGKSSLVKTSLKMERGSIVIVGGPEFESGVLIILISAD